MHGAEDGGDVGVVEDAAAGEVGDELLHEGGGGEELGGVGVEVRGVQLEDDVVAGLRPGGQLDGGHAI